MRTIVVRYFIFMYYLFLIELSKLTNFSFFA